MNPSQIPTELGPMDRQLLRGYDCLWRAAIPWLKHAPRLTHGYAQRCLATSTAPLPPSDLWWQAASAGEAYLAVTLIQALGLKRPTRLLVTTQTLQGFDILTRTAEALRQAQAPLEMAVRYLPFDRPHLMQTAVAQARPRLAVLLETELWPGLMLALKNAGVLLLVLNARMSPGSLKRYQWRPSLWRSLRPDAVLALSRADAGRFASLFGHTGVATMSNIKFDRVNAVNATPSAELRALVAKSPPVVVFGSVRRAEEVQIETLLKRLHQRHPEAVLAMVPRHMERLPAWQTALRRGGLPWVLRSKADARHPVLSRGGVLLWDTFGELGAAYALASGAYVGGSLVPLGGQNFLEPLAQGLRPVIGPHWDNFAWVGRAVIHSGLVQEVADLDGAFRALSTAIERPSGTADKTVVRQALDAYLAPRRGGSDQAAALIRSYLVSEKRKRTP